jgi:hypothetical protein
MFFSIIHTQKDSHIKENRAAHKAYAKKNDKVEKLE